MSSPSPDRSDALLKRIADALDRLAPASPPAPNFDAAEAFIWRADSGALAPVARVNRVDLSLLRGIDRVRDLLIENTRRFARALPANNALLWGARGMGKSSLVKAAHAAINREPDVALRLKLVEIHREDIEGLPALMRLLRDAPYRFIVFCDDLSFDAGDTSYKSLKAALEGGVEGRPANVLFYATSNRRHLMPRDMMENERSSAIIPGEAVEEKVSLSDRFGLWLGFHHCSQDDYLAMVHGYAKHFRLDAPAAELEAEALEWATTRGARSGRAAWQFTQDLAGRLGKPLDPAFELDPPAALAPRRRVVAGALVPGIAAGSRCPSERGSGTPARQSLHRSLSSLPPPVQRDADGSKGVGKLAGLNSALIASPFRERKKQGRRAFPWTRRPCCPSKNKCVSQKSSRVGFARQEPGPLEIPSGRSEAGEIVGRIDRGRSLAQFEMELRRVDIAGIAGLGDDLAALDRFPAFDLEFARCRRRQSRSRWDA